METCKNELSFYLKGMVLQLLDVLHSYYLLCCLLCCRYGKSMTTVVIYTSVRGSVISDYYIKGIMCVLEVVVVDTYSVLMLPLVEVLQLRCVIIVLCTIWALAHGNCLRKNKKLRRFRIGLVVA